MLGRIVFNGLLAGLILLSTAAVRAERAREIVTYDDVHIEVITEGSGPLVVLLASRSRCGGFRWGRGGNRQGRFSCSATAATRRRPQQRTDERSIAA